MPREDYRRAQFLTSAAELKQLPPDHGREIAFVGRSNAGKSSALNALCDQKALARTSKTPGRTRLINLFKLDETRRLVDLPGYGFAKVALSLKKQWEGSLTKYLEKRDSLQGLILLMDIRHPMQPLDVQMLEWCESIHRPVHILLTKADKLSRNEANKALFQTEKQLAGRNSVQLFSSTAKQGLSDAYQQLDVWMELIPTEKNAE